MAKTFDVDLAKKRLEASKTVDIDKLTQSDIDQFFDFFRFIANENLFDKCVEHLKDQGYFQIVFSVEVFRELQTMLLADAKSVANLSPHAKNYLMCGKTNRQC